jgi:hypothetical protein
MLAVFVWRDDSLTTRKKLKGKDLFGKAILIIREELKSTDLLCEEFMIIVAFVEHRKYPT